MPEKINTNGLRSSLSGLTQQKEEEKITQIMRPSLLLKTLQNSVLQQRTQQLVGEYVVLNFDMI